MKTQDNKTRFLTKITDRLFGGIRMTWPKVIAFAVISAAVTAVFLIMPVFQNTSFERMGVYFEAWIFFAVIIMTNCASPLESALKTFVFFLVSQPLIYLFQVLAASADWEIFRFYRYWFVWTIGTLPMAYAGWYVKKRNWLSLLILAPVLLYLSGVCVNSFRFTLGHFPLRLFTALFCLFQVVLYLFAFTSDRTQKLAGFVIPFVSAVLFLLLQKNVIISDYFLPGDPVLSEAASVTVDDPGFVQITIVETGADSMIRVQADRFGTTAFTIQDGETEYHYNLKIYEDDGGHSQILITQD